MNMLYVNKLLFVKMFIGEIIHLALQELYFPSADLEVQLVQLNHCDGVYNNY